MKIGIDFGTTRVVVASADRGNYPLVNFEAPDGRIRDWFPSTLAVSGERRGYGWEALELESNSDWTIVRSLKRFLKDAGPHSEIEVAGQRLNLSLVTTEMLAALQRELVESSSLGAGKSDRLEAMLGVPANANSNQRFLTEEAARVAGFDVLGLSNEPSAAAIEFAHRDSADRKGRPKSGLLVYDLGGGEWHHMFVHRRQEQQAVECGDEHRADQQAEFHVQISPFFAGSAFSAGPIPARTAHTQTRIASVKAQRPVFLEPAPGIAPRESRIAIRRNLSAQHFPVVRTGVRDSSRLQRMSAASRQIRFASRSARRPNAAE